MAVAPPFLRHLNLDTEADERAVRRAYAQLLKQIDQEADPQAFQSLREAYEAALNWARHQAQHRAEATNESDSMALAESEEAVPEVVGASEVQPVAVQVESREPVRPVNVQPSPQDLANEVFIAFVQAFPDRLDSKPEAAQRLDHCLNDGRLVNLDVHDFFEWRVAEWLVQGWRPGNEFLFVVASERFNWQNDRRRLMRFGRVGQIIDVAIHERMAFDRQSKAARDAQVEAIQRLRETGHPGDHFLLKKMPALELAAEDFPNWLRLVTRVDNIQLWRKWERAVPEWRRTITPQPKKPSRPPPVQVAKKGWNWQWSLVVFGVINLLRLITGGSHTSYEPAQSYQPSSSWSQPANVPGPARTPSFEQSLSRDAPIWVNPADDPWAKSHVSTQRKPVASPEGPPQPFVLTPKPNSSYGDSPGREGAASERHRQSVPSTEAQLRRAEAEFKAAHSNAEQTHGQGTNPDGSQTVAPSSDTPSGKPAEPTPGVAYQNRVKEARAAKDWREPPDPVMLDYKSLSP